MSQLNKRSEILFCYDIQDANPNGDPLDENKPRIDEETKTNIVTDVRLKRTVRDYLYETEKQEIYIREVRKDDGKLKTKEDRLTDLKVHNPEDLLKFIDIRLFGATTAVKDRTITFTGPVQFQMGRSLHRVEMKFIKGTTVMPSGADKAQGTFTGLYILPYSFICFHGVVNETAAKETNLQSEDIDLLLKAMWQGTKNLISRSKFGQIPRLIMKVDYSKEGFFIGELNKLVKLETEKIDEQIRDVTEFKLNLENLKMSFIKNLDKINKVYYQADERLNLSTPLKDLLPGKMQELKN